MSFPQIVEVGVGLILIYYLLGAIVSTITQLVLESLETRGAALERYLKKIAGDRTVDLTNLPQIRALRPIRYAKWWNVLGARTAEMRLEKIPVETLVDAFFDLSGLTARGSLSAQELASVIGKLPESEGKRAMLGWVNQGVTALSDLRSRTSTYFAGMLNQAALTFRAKARSFVVAASIVVTLLFGVDSLQLANDLWTDAGLRSVAAQQAEASTMGAEGVTDVTTLMDQLNGFTLRIGWWRTSEEPAPGSTVEWLALILMKAAGLGITATAVSQGSSFWYDVLKRITGSSSPPGATSDGGGAVG